MQVKPALRVDINERKVDMIHFNMLGLTSHVCRHLQLLGTVITVPQSAGSLVSFIFENGLETPEWVCTAWTCQEGYSVALLAHWPLPVMERFPLALS